MSKDDKEMHADKLRSERCYGIMESQQKSAKAYERFLRPPYARTIGTIEFVDVPDDDQEEQKEV